MLEYAAGVAAQLGATVVPASGGNSDESSAAAGGGGGSIAFVQGDMADFSIAAVEGQLDVAVCLLGTFAHMTSNEAAIASLRCVARHLRPGGLLLLELAHPGACCSGCLGPLQSSPYFRSCLRPLQAASCAPSANAHCIKLKRRRGQPSSYCTPLPPSPPPPR